MSTVPNLVIAFKNFFCKEFPQIPPNQIRVAVAPEVVIFDVVVKHFAVSRLEIAELIRFLQRNRKIVERLEMGADFIECCINDFYIPWIVVFILTIGENKPVYCWIMGATVKPYLEVIVEMSEIWNNKDNRFHVISLKCVLAGT